MQVKFEFLGRKLMIEARAGYVFIETSRHEFFYHPDWLFEGRNGGDRHWCGGRKTSAAVPAFSAQAAGE